MAMWINFPSFLRFGDCWRPPGCFVRQSGREAGVLWLYSYWRRCSWLIEKKLITFFYRFLYDFKISFSFVWRIRNSDVDFLEREDLPVFGGRPWTHTDDNPAGDNPDGKAVVMELDVGQRSWRRSVGDWCSLSDGGEGWLVLGCGSFSPLPLSALEGCWIYTT